jgi:hypothetical protein
MAAETYRACWIDEQGAMVRDERFEYDVAAHESAGFIRPEALVNLALDAPYFVLRELQQHVGGHIETALLSADSFIIVNEDGHGLGLQPQRSPLVTLASVAYALQQGACGQPFYFVGPVVLVWRER